MNSHILAIILIIKNRHLFMHVSVIRCMKSIHKPNNRMIMDETNIFCFYDWSKSDY